jgi:hypothetical protein
VPRRSVEARSNQGGEPYFTTEAPTNSNVRLLSKVADTHHFNADQDPAPQQDDANLQPLLALHKSSKPVKEEQNLLPPFSSESHPCCSNPNYLYSVLMVNRTITSCHCRDLMK